MMITGNTEIIAHIGYPTHAFKAPMIYNPWFEKVGVNLHQPYGTGETKQQILFP